MIVAAVALSWAATSGVVALLIGRCIRMVDESAPSTDLMRGLPTELTVEHILGARKPQPSL